MQSWHLTFSADGRSALFRSEAQRRRAVRTLARVAGQNLLLFCVVDDHVHVVLLCEEGRTGVAARALLLALRPVAGPGLGPAHVRPVEGRSHLLSLVRYCLRQPLKHGIGVHPALWTGSCFLDLVGARLIDGYAPSQREALPRFRQRTLFEHVGLPALPLHPVDDEALRAVGSNALVQATSAALAAPPDLRGNTPVVVAVRRVVAQLGQVAGLNTAQIARALDVKPNAALRLGKAPPQAPVLRAVRLRLALEARVLAQPLVLAEDPVDYGDEEWGAAGAMKPAPT